MVGSASDAATIAKAHLIGPPENVTRGYHTAVAD
jgi:hypothetical protein